MLDLKNYRNAKRYMQETGLPLEEAISKLEKEIIDGAKNRTEK